MGSLNRNLSGEITIILVDYLVPVKRKIPIVFIAVNPGLRVLVQYALVCLAFCCVGDAVCKRYHLRVL